MKNNKSEEKIDYEENCWKCGGSGTIEESTPDLKKKYYTCIACFGSGKLDWVSNILRKESKIVFSSGYTGPVGNGYPTVQSSNSFFRVKK